MKGKKELTKRLDHDLAAPMFVLSLVVLALFASLIYLTDLEQVGRVNSWWLVGLAILYPIFWLETAAHLYAGSRNMKQHIWFCLMPITRIGARDHDTGQEIWLPKMRWREIDRHLEKILARKFSIPMIAIALMVLPIIVMEFFYKDFVDSNQGWRIAMNIAEAFIWAAFSFEFVLMTWIVKYPMSYAKRHWIDLAIILLPMLAFMRTLRLASIGRLNQLSRTARIFRLRGLAMRMWRGFVALELIELLLTRDPEQRLEKLEMQLQDRMEEIGFLEKDINRLRERVRKKQLEAEANESSSKNNNTSSESSTEEGGTDIPESDDPGLDDDSANVRQSA